MGSYMTLLLGRPLVKLNYDQLDKEAGFRAALIHVRENAESILLARREDVQSARLLRRLDRVITNFRAITTVNRNVGFFTTGYNWAIQIIPALIIAPATLPSRIRRDHAIGHGLLDGCGRVFLVCHPVSVAFGVYRRCCSA
jgi:putative ATP-binding cassette transporter